MGTPEKWTDEQNSIVREWAGKIEAARIALKVNAATGSTYTRNAVIGRMRRLGLDGLPRPKAVRRIRTARPARVVKLSVVRIAPPPPSPVKSINIPFLDGEPGQCRYITSPEEAPALICGHPVELGSYCEWHRSITEQRGCVVSGFRKRSNPYATIQGRPGFSAQG